MVFKKGNPGCACCCPCYYFEGNGGNNRPLTEHSAVYSNTASQGDQSAKFVGASYFEREKHWCFTPYGKTTWTVSFDMKVVDEPTFPQTQAMGLVTRGSWSGNPPTGTLSGEWAIIYRAVESGTTVLFVLKTSSDTNVFPIQETPTTVIGVAIDGESGAGTNGFNTLSWTIGPGTLSTVVANTQTITDNYAGSLVYGDDALLVGDNTGGLKLGEGSGEILIDNLCFDYT